MRIRRTIGLLAFLCCWPWLGHANDAIIPELGVRIPDNPDLTSPPLIIRRADGYEARLLVGTVQLIIARLAEVVPPGGSVRDKEYVASLHDDFHDNLSPNAREALTAI